LGPAIDGERLPVQTPQPVYTTAGIAQPADLTGQMAAALVAGSLALQKFGQVSNEQIANVMKPAVRLYNVTMTTKGVVEHPRDLWQSNSFYDDRAWAVRPLVALAGACL
jgi:hypothetical protein